MAAKKQTPLHKNYIAILAAITLVVVTYFISQQVLAAKDPGPEFKGYSASYDPASDNNRDGFKNLGSGASGLINTVISIPQVPAGNYFVTVSAHIGGATGCALSKDDFSPSSLRSFWPTTTNTDSAEYTESYSLSQAGSITLYCQGNGSDQMQEGKVSLTAVRIKAD